MKKPIVLLVDDDPTVLESLEALLSPAFGPVCRIEGFNDPREVLSAMRDWGEERRRVAIAVVDQKMPGMTGVELVSRLRADARNAPPGVHPATGMEALLLTGHAGLSSAIEAINEAGFARYLEKPWDGPALIGLVREGLARHFESTGVGVYFSIREVEDEAGVHAVLELGRARSRAIGAGTSGVACHGTFDGFEATSRFLACRGSLGDSATPAGTVRIAGSDETRATPAVKTFFRTDPEAPDVPDAALLPLPLFADREIGRQVRPFLEALIDDGDAVGEPGAMVVGPARGDRAECVRLLADGAVAAMMVWGIDDALLACTPAQGLNWRRLGFVPSPGPAGELVRPPNPDVVCLWGRPDAAPEHKVPLPLLAERLRTTGSICRCPAYPDCIPEPFASGKAASNDLFCPREAERLLTHRRREP